MRTAGQPRCGWSDSECCVWVQDPTGRRHSTARVGQTPRRRKGQHAHGRGRHWNWGGSPTPVQQLTWQWARPGRRPPSGTPAPCRPCRAALRQGNAWCTPEFLKKAKQGVKQELPKLGRDNGLRRSSAEPCSWTVANRLTARQAAAAHLPARSSGCTRRCLSTCSGTATGPPAPLRQAAVGKAKRAAAEPTGYPAHTHTQASLACLPSSQPRLLLSGRRACPLPAGLRPHLFSSPSHLRRAVKTQVLAGMLRPMAKVSVLNRHCGREGREVRSNVRNAGQSDAGE